MSSAVGRADTTDSVCKAAIAQTGRLALRKAREAAGLVAHTSAVVGTPRIDHHGGCSGAHSPPSKIASLKPAM